MRTVSRALIGSFAAGAMAVSAATPAIARDNGYDRDGIDPGDIIAGAVVLGGIAVLAGATGGDRDGYGYRDGRHRDGRQYGRGNPRSAVERCVNAVERQARRYGYRYADVTRIRNIDETRDGWRVKGNLAVDRAHGNGRYDRDRYGVSDRGKFSCRIDHGRITDIDFDGLRGLR